jgi:effector-binding domain-containing protein
MRTALVEDRTLAQQPTAVRRAILSPAEVAEWRPVALSEIAESLRRGRIVPNGFPFVRRHRGPDGHVYVEAGFPVGTPVVTDGRILASSLPAGPVAVTMYAGPYDGIGAAYDLIADWLRRRGARPCGAAWEVYHDPPIERTDGWRTEIVQPYRPAFDEN